VDPAYVMQAVRHVAARCSGPALPAGTPLTLNFHPDAQCGQDTMISALARDRVYRSQFETGSSNGGLTAYPGGDRWTWESKMFGGIYDQAEPALRPKYGALNYRRWGTGGSPRFGSCHLRLREHVLERTTFCYPDSHLDPQHFGVQAKMGLIELANLNPNGLDVLDDYVEAHVHGPVSIKADVEAIVLDPCFRGTAIEDAARAMCPVAWHSGFRVTMDWLDEFIAYRGAHVAELMRTLARGNAVTPIELGAARGAAIEGQALKQAWHCVARFGSPDL
jgi:hypothetical protein